MNNKEILQKLAKIAANQQKIIVRLAQPAPKTLRSNELTDAQEEADSVARLIDKYNQDEPESYIRERDSSDYSPVTMRSSEIENGPISEEAPISEDANLLQDADEIINYLVNKEVSRNDLLMMSQAPDLHQVARKLNLNLSPDISGYELREAIIAAYNTLYGY